MKSKILILVSVLAFFACKKEDVLTGSPKQATPVSFTVIGQGALYGNGGEGIAQSNLVLTNDTDWQNLMSQMNSVNNVTDNFSGTNVNFSDSMLVAVFLDVKQSGWSVEVSGIEESATEITVAQKDTPSVSSVITQPFHIVRMAKTSKTIVFE